MHANLTAGWAGMELEWTHAGRQMLQQQRGWYQPSCRSVAYPAQDMVTNVALCISFAARATTWAATVLSNGVCQVLLSPCIAASEPRASVMEHAAVHHLLTCPLKSFGACFAAAWVLPRGSPRPLIGLS